MEWFAVQSSGILRGSLCNADDTVQLIWVKYMAMANEAHNPDNGRLEFKKGDPYPVDYLATQCRKTAEEVVKAEKEFMADLNRSDGVTPRLIIEPDGTRILSNWGRKQGRGEFHKNKSKDAEKPKVYKKDDHAGMKVE